MEHINKKNSWFVRVLIVLLCILLASMVIFSYFYTYPKGEINSGVITLLFLLLILILSESFDNFSLGKIFTLSREAQRKGLEVKKLEKEKAELFNQFIKFTSIQNQTQHQTQNQTQQHTNIYGDYHVGRDATVERASDQEIEAEIESKVSDEHNQPHEIAKKRIVLKEIEMAAMQKYALNKGLNAANIITDAKLSTQFHGIDPISNIQPIFDAYYNLNGTEVFVEFKINRGFFLMLRDQVYMMLSKLNHYQNAKGVNAHLELVFLNIPEENINYREKERFLRDFEPAISSGLLRIDEIDFSTEEADACRREG
ncbi:hypothetical protein [Edwardsiella tarda]|uniref:hypothetical protein n=1 Tax=Edwardsiella tarda TaxID=636 RepID=UPI00351CA234